MTRDSCMRDVSTSFDDVRTGTNLKRQEERKYPDVPIRARYRRIAGRVYAQVGIPPRARSPSRVRQIAE